jgi:hypothetical protein
LAIIVRLRRVTLSMDGAPWKVLSARDRIEHQGDTESERFRGRERKREKERARERERERERETERNMRTNNVLRQKKRQDREQTKKGSSLEA